jgi:homoserine dehydrogenase
VIGTHEATEAALAATVRDLAAHSVVTTVASVLRVEGA